MTAPAQGAEVRVVDHGVLLGVGGSSWVLPSLAPAEAAALAAGLLRVAYGAELVTALRMCAEVGLDGAPDDALPGEHADQLFDLLKQWEATS